MNPLSNATIDCSSDDNGFLPCARTHNTSATVHGSTQQAVARLVQQLNSAKCPMNIHIVGHGDSGIVVTGTGDVKVNTSQYVSRSNPSEWEPHFRELRGRAASLRFWACHPGAGPAGAEFLHRVASAIGAPVFGPTGFVYCEGRPEFSLENRAEWQKAEPGGVPTPIAAPKPYVPKFPNELRLRADKASIVIRPGDVRSVRLYSGKGTDVVTLLSWEAQETADVLRLVQFDRPFTPPGPPGAIVTGTLVLEIEREGKPEQRTFYIYNNQLLQDRTSPDTYYAAADFSTLQRPE